MPQERTERRLGPNSSFRIGEWRVQRDLNRITREGEQHQIEPRLMDVLCDLATHAPDVRGRDELLAAVWGEETFVSEEVLNRAISELRRLFGDSARKPRYIETIRGRGYRLIAEVERTSLAAKPDKRRSPHLAIVGALLLFATLAWVVHDRDKGKSGVPPVATLAVLPFAELPDDRAGGHLAFGVTDALITKLARLGSFDVISRTSAMRFLDSNLDLPTIARQLGADAIVEGSVERLNDRLRLNVQLIDARTDVHVWADIYEDSIENVLVLHEKIARDIGHELGRSQAEETGVAVPIAAAAWESYARGRFLWQQGTAASIEAAIEAYREALEIEPNFAQAAAGLADSYILLALYELLSPDEAYQEARRWTLEALSLDPNLGEAHSTLGAIRLFYEWDFPRARESLERALEINPSHPLTYLAYADLWSVLGQPSKAVDAARQGVKLDPFNPILHNTLGDFLSNAGRTEEALAAYQRLVEIHPSFVPGYVHMAQAHLLGQDAEAARGILSEIAARFPPAVSNGEGVAVLRAELGDRRAALDALETLDEADGFVAPARRARLHYALGDLEKTFEWLHREIDQRGQGALWCAHAGSWQRLREDPRIDDLLGRVNLAPKGSAESE